MKRAKRAQATSSTTAPITTTTAATQSISLAGKVCDQVTELSDVFKAYLAVQRFVAPEYADEASASVQPSRAELAALLRTLNEEIVRRMAALADVTTLQQAQLTIDAAQAR